ncbi:crinkler (CRN) family protein, putative [Rhizophagus clarus]|uniref:Crinkler (CRN) family protein, putative n=1 Tax=Rhizophagus clarus TaxID=94130 RepID=A0A8H3R4W9_9GLOM|nr:crinkler (CRN) family protein, putative [Rhizophagus clarus]
MASANNVRKEIDRLSKVESGITEKEFGELLAYIVDNPSKVTEIEETLGYGNDNVKLNFLRQLIAQTKIEIRDAFPEGLLYVKPAPLLLSTGANWEYQPDPTLKEILQKAVRGHYESFLQGNIDKSHIPLYLFLSGAGTGKSRNANEFYQTAISCLSVSKDKDLLARIKDAYVFHVSYENGTSLRPGEDPFLAIGTRMLAQLLREEMSFEEVRLTYEPPSPLSVVSLVAKYRNRDLKDVTVILVVDAMQQIMSSPDDGLKEDSDFYRTMSSVGDLGLQNVFLLPCVTSTITCSVEKALKFSHRKRVYLPVSSLKPPMYRQGNKIIPVFETKEMMDILVEDCGGHGRALEALHDCMAGRSIVNCNVDNLMNDLRFILTDNYREAIQNAGRDTRAIARAILTRTLLDVDKPVPKTEKKPDEFVHTGLIRFERQHEAPVGYFTAPYIWLWILVENSQKWGDPILRDWSFADYKEIREFLSSPGSKPCQGFERFVATFRCLKSAVIGENEPTKISEVHAGAYLNGDLEFINHNLQLEFAKHRTDTKSENIIASSWNVECNNSFIDVRQFKHCIINSPGSKAGDAFLSLDLPDGESLNEVQQYKHTRNSIKQELYLKERAKSSSDDDFFILFTTSEDCDVKLPERSGIVYGKNFREYFGPFAGRAFRHARVRSVASTPKMNMMNMVNINTDSIERLRTVNLIGEKRANTIILRRPFKGIKDSNEKTNPNDYSHFTEKANIEFAENPKEQDQDSSITDSEETSEVQANPLISAEVNISTAPIPLTCSSRNGSPASSRTPIPRTNPNKMECLYQYVIEHGLDPKKFSIVTEAEKKDGIVLAVRLYNDKLYISSSLVASMKSLHDYHMV